MITRDESKKSIQLTELAITEKLTTGDMFRVKGGAVPAAPAAPAVVSTPQCAPKAPTVTGFAG